MDRPKSILCRATFTRGNEVEWWEWVYDEETKAYVLDGQRMSPSYIMAAAAVKQLEGWELCRAVV